mgnify:CR=1 FL=1
MLNEDVDIAVLNIDLLNFPEYMIENKQDYIAQKDGNCIIL